MFAAGEAGRGFLDLVKALLEVGHFGLAASLPGTGPWNSDAILGGALPIHWPTMRSTPRQLFRGRWRSGATNRDDDQFTPPDIDMEDFAYRAPAPALLTGLGAAPRLFLNRPFKAFFQAGVFSAIPVSREGQGVQGSLRAKTSDGPFAAEQPSAPAWGCALWDRWTGSARGFFRSLVIVLHALLETLLDALRERRPSGPKYCRVRTQQDNCGSRRSSAKC